MSRIAALWNRDGRPVASETLTGLVRGLGIAGLKAPRMQLAGAAGLLFQTLGDGSSREDCQPASDMAGAIVSFDGRLDNRDELLDVLGADLRREPATIADADLVLASYRRWGARFAGHLNGDFACALFDRGEQRMLLARDPVGVRPLYWSVAGSTLIAASEIKMILAHPAVESRPNDDALADVLVGGDPNELRLTCFSGVLRARPGQTVVVTRDSVTESRHWGFDPLNTVRLGSVGEYAEALREHFERAVRRRLGSSGPVAVMVSGGLDSSAVLCQAEVLRTRGEPVAAAFGVSQVFRDGSEADEKSYLADIEASYGVQIERIAFDSFEFVDDASWVWRTEFPHLLLDADIESLRHAARCGARTVIDGNYGDQMMSSEAWFSELAVRFRWLKLREAWRGYTESMLDCTPEELFRGAVRQWVRDTVPDQMMRPVRTVRRMLKGRRQAGWYSASLAARAFDRSQRQRRPRTRGESLQARRCHSYFHQAHVVNALEEFNKVAATFRLEKAYPFLDRDLVAFMMAIPAEMVAWRGAFKGLFREAMRGVLPERIRTRTWKADFTSLNTAAADRACGRCRAYIGPGSFGAAMGYLDHASADLALTRHQLGLEAGRAAASAKVASVFGFELWLRAYWGVPTAADDGGRTEQAQALRATA